MMSEEKQDLPKITTLVKEKKCWVCLGRQKISPDI